MRIEDVTGLVTGANRGLGRSLAGELAKRGARTVYGGARHPAEVSMAGVTPAMAGVTPVKLDITDRHDVAGAAQRCSDVNLLINNAAVLAGASLLAAPTLAPARHEMETNYFGTLSM
jgi:NAD(P)-dependent dehydrogenase (short-subunit alcohol dehydrogenase family)